MALRVVLPLALNVLWALVCLVIMPQQVSVPLSRFVFSDVGLVVELSGAVALVWGILRAMLAFFVLRTRDASRAAEAPVTA